MNRRAQIAFVTPHEPSDRPAPLRAVTGDIAVRCVGSTTHFIMEVFGYFE